MHLPPVSDWLDAFTRDTARLFRQLRDAIERTDRPRR
jgi:hypothetical protein